MDDRRLTFGEHLEELRGHVFRALIYGAVGLVVCLFFQEPLMRAVTAPHARAMAEVAAEDRARVDRTLAAARALAEVLEETRDLGLASRPEKEREALALKIAEAASELNRTAAGAGRLRFLNYSETFFAYLEVALICGFLLASPAIVFEIWRFVAAGLYEHEKKWARVFGPLTFLCFAGGCAFGYYILIPATLEYLASYGSPDVFEASVTVDGYLRLFLGLTAAIGLVFELPLVLVFLSLVNVVTAPLLAEHRRYWFFASTVIAAIITPTGDPWTLGIVAVPLVLLYEIGILCVRLVEKATLEKLA